MFRRIIYHTHTFCFHFFLPLITYAPRGRRRGGGSRLLYISIAYYVETKWSIALIATVWRQEGGGGLVRLPVNRFVDIAMCTPNLTPKVYLSMTAIISFYELPLLSKTRPNLYIPLFL